MNLNYPPSSEQDHDYYDHQPYPQLFRPNFRVAASSSSSGSCHTFFNSAQDHHPTAFFNHQLYHPKQDHAYAYSGGSSSHEMIKNKSGTSGLKLTLWKKEPDQHDHVHDHSIVTHGHDHSMVTHDHGPVKWISSKTRVMQKTKTKPAEHRTLKITSSSKTKIDHDHDHKLKQSSSFEANDSTNKISSYNNNSPIRVCSDCNTTKTPLWRSGPKGPKSLCNACGIRQRKARRALAAAGNNVAGIASEQTTNALKIKVQNNKDKNIISKHVPLKKRYRLEAAAASSTTSGGSQSHGRKIEDFLMNFSKNLAFHRMFPEDEKDAAILLMALSSGLIQG